MINLVRLLGLGIALSVFSSTVVCAGTLNGINLLSASDTSDGNIIIKVELTESLTVQPTGFTISSPPRIAFDFTDTVNNMGRSVQDFAVTNLRSAHIVQAGNRTRLVVNLEKMLAYDTEIDGNTLLITLFNRARENTTSASTRFAEENLVSNMHELRDIDFRRGKSGEGLIQIDLSDSGVGIDMRQQGNTLTVDFLKTQLPQNLQRKLDVSDFATPVQNVETFVQGDNVRMVIVPTGNWEHAAFQTDNKFIIEVKKIQEEAGGSSKGGKSGYTGEKLTLNFQKIDVREALNVIADFTELNVVISDTVRGNITLRLKDVPWDQALDIILQSRGLDMRKNGNVIQVAPRAEIAAKEKDDMTSRQELEELEEMHTESFQLSYSQGSDIVSLLTSKDQRILSERGSAVVDVRTNTLFIQDTPTNLDEARKLIRQIDVAVSQVLIEARFVEAGDTFTRTLGGKLGFSSPLKPSAVPGGFASGLIGSNNVSLPGGSSGDRGVNILFNAASGKALGLELTASELDGKTKSIASPRVVTANGESASIEAGVEIPYLQASSSGATSVAFKKATLSLKVTPQITPDDNVNLKVDVNQDTVGDIFSGIPSINTKRVSTQVLVENGGTVVIGGIYTQDESKSSNKVPLLGDIPVIGWLFREETKVDNKRELLIFITPKILSDKLNLR
ncbi:MAG: type IV pilus secretin PilQ [Gallionella sp.]